MKKAFVLTGYVCSIFLFTACSKAWTTTQKTNFLLDCAAHAESIGERAPAYCDCLQKKVEAKYPNISKANKMSKKEKEAMTVECLK